MLLLMLKASLTFSQDSVKNNIIPIDFDILTDYNLQASSIDVSKPVHFFVRPEIKLPKDDIHIESTDLAILKDYNITDLNADNISLAAFFKKNSNKVLTIQFSTGKLVSGGYAFQYTLSITSDGALRSSKINLATLAPAPAKSHFVSDLFSKQATIAGLKEGSFVVDDCRQDVVIYYPCCNLTTILSPDKDNRVYHKMKYLKYQPDFLKNHGVIFIIANYNPLKYTTSVGTTYATNYLDIPSNFTSILPFLTNAAAAQNAIPHPVAKTDPKTEMNTEIINILTLNKELRNFLNQDCVPCATPGDCTDMENEKKNILGAITSTFLSTNILLHYASVKEYYLKNTATDNETYNSDFTENLLITISPDTLASQTQVLVNLLAATSFYAQFNVPKLQNADKIIFNLNLAPVSGMAGTLNISSQDIPVQIRGGFRMDWSSGFYFSSVKNENYTLQPQPPTDTLNKIFQKIISVAELMG